MSDNASSGGVEGNEGVVSLSSNHSNTDTLTPSFYSRSEGNKWVAPSFEDLVNNWQGHPGTFYERKHGLKPRCVYGKLQNSDVGTITYVTDDGRVGFILALRRSKSWIAFYPTDQQFNYFMYDLPNHIKQVLINNKKEYKVK